MKTRRLQYPLRAGSLVVEWPDTTDARELADIHQLLGLLRRVIARRMRRAERLEPIRTVWGVVEADVA